MFQFLSISKFSYKIPLFSYAMFLLKMSVGFNKTYASPILDRHVSHVPCMWHVKVQNYAFFWTASEWPSERAIYDETQGSDEIWFYTWYSLFLFIVFPFLTIILTEEVTIGRLTPSWVTFFGCTTRELWWGVLVVLHPWQAGVTMHVHQMQDMEMLREPWGTHSG